MPAAGSTPVIRDTGQRGEQRCREGNDSRRHAARLPLSATGRKPPHQENRKALLRRGFNELTLPKWQAFLALREEFNQAVGTSIYALLPGIVDSTFGC